MFNRGMYTSGMPFIVQWVEGSIFPYEISLQTHALLNVTSASQGMKASTRKGRLGAYCLGFRKPANYGTKYQVFEKNPFLNPLLTPGKQSDFMNFGPICMFLFHKGAPSFVGNIRIK